LGKDKWKVTIKRNKGTYSAVGHWRTTFRKGGKGRGRRVFFGVYKEGGRSAPFMHGAPPGWNVKPDGKNANNVLKKGSSKFRPPQMEKLEEHRAKIKKRLSRPEALSEAKYNKAMEDSKAKLSKAFDEAIKEASFDLEGYSYNGKAPKTFEHFLMASLTDAANSNWAVNRRKKLMSSIFEKVAPTVVKAQKINGSDKELSSGGKQSKSLKSKYGVRLKTLKSQKPWQRESVAFNAMRAMILLSEAMGSKEDNLNTPVISVKYTAKRASFSFGPKVTVSCRGISSTYHEFTHWLEKTNTQIADAGLRFWSDRTSGDVPTKLRQVANPSYGESEVTCPDKFADPYIGRMYSDISYTEVATMGVQCFSSRSAAFDLMRNDPEHFAFALAIVNGAFGKGAK
jgi:hypothetical protein